MTVVAAIILGGLTIGYGLHWGAPFAVIAGPLLGVLAVRMGRRP